MPHILRMHLPKSLNNINQTPANIYLNKRTYNIDYVIYIYCVCVQVTVTVNVITVSCASVQVNVITVYICTPVHIVITVLCATVQVNASKVTHTTRRKYAPRAT